MDKLTKRQLQRIGHFFREKEERAKAEKFRHRAAGGDGRRKESTVRLIAGKVDQVLIVSSFASPPLKTGLIDRFLVMAGLEGADAVILFNKADLLESRDEGEAVAGLYRSLGYTAFTTSSVTGEGIDILREHVAGRVSLLAGHSGVGKSSLLNLLQSGLSARAEVREVSEATGKGKHTTTSVRLYRLDEKTVIFDLPGIKLASLHGTAAGEIAEHFPEFRQPSRSCRYRDCLHLEEPECAVRRALVAGTVDARRYDSYRRIVSRPAAES
jgi:ribosome biogenesis GTPase